MHAHKEVATLRHAKQTGSLDHWQVLEWTVQLLLIGSTAESTAGAEYIVDGYILL